MTWATETINFVSLQIYGDFVEQMKFTNSSRWETILPVLKESRRLSFCKSNNLNKYNHNT
jgi:hypothetical protein